jgi:hypothetical protein
VQVQRKTSWHSRISMKRLWDCNHLRSKKCRWLKIPTRHSRYSLDLSMTRELATVVGRKGVARGLMIGLMALEVEWRSALGRMASEGWRSAAARSCSMVKRGRISKT